MCILNDDVIFGPPQNELTYSPWEIGKDIMDDSSAGIDECKKAEVGHIATRDLNCGLIPVMDCVQWEHIGISVYEKTPRGVS